LEDDSEPETKDFVDQNQFPIVGIGASAGGITALELFFENLPADSGIGFVIIIHLDPTRESIVGSMIESHAHIEVHDIENEVTVQPNIAYIIPPDRNVRIKDGKLFLEEFDMPRGLRLPIDHFFRSLAEEKGENAVGIILSGTGTDGTLGMREIKARGGTTMVQDPTTTEYPGMPTSALSSLSIDHVLRPEEMPAALMSHVNYAGSWLEDKLAYTDQNLADLLSQVHEIVRNVTGQASAVYKRNTIIRRIQRRMVINQINTLESYIDLLRENPAEVENLFQEFLISVTHFFRDKEAFNNLNETVIKPLCKNCKADEGIRVWIPGCATGEEAYSIAILFHEQLELLKLEGKVQIFATDIDGNAISKARNGIYPENITADIDPELLSKYFVKQDGTFQVKKVIRSMIIFARQNTLSDPPFSNIDLISCRNLLIYLRPEMQKQIIDLFYSSLKKDGFLFLGTSEMIMNVEDLFEEVDKKAKVFQKTIQGSYISGHIRPYSPILDLAAHPDILSLSTKKPASYRQVIENRLLADYSPPAVIVNRKSEVLFVHGRTGKFLEPATGITSANILDMAREGLKVKLLEGLRKASFGSNDVTLKDVHVKTNGEWTSIDITIKSISDPEEMKGLFLIVFEENEADHAAAASEPESEGTIIGAGESTRIAQLENELNSTKEYLRTTIEEIQNANEELKSTNEELQSSNEELKSTNEELQTSKEEMQSLNEELLTVNNELQSKITQLSKTNDDLRNFISSTDIATVFVDSNLNIKRFTPRAHNIFNLIQSDVGRPLYHISANLDNVTYFDDIKSVLDNLVPVEKDVKLKDKDVWYTMRVMPFRTEENVIDGVVMTFMDVSAAKVAKAEVEISRGKYRDAYNNAEFLKSILVHDINNILGVISMAAEFLKTKEMDSSDEKLQAYIIKILDQVERGSMLVKNVMKKSELEQSKEIGNYPVDLVSIVHDAITYIKKSYTASGDVEFEVNTNGYDRLLVTGNDYFVDALENIIINGITYNKSSPKRIVIDVEGDVDGEPDKAKISIIDNGIGMREEMKRLIMSGMRQKKTEGSRSLGVGLTLVNQIVTKLNGTLLFENSEPGDYTKGTKVRILLQKEQES